MGDLRRRYAAWTSMAVHAVQEVLRDDCLGIAVYGSVARETPHDGSDIDLLVVAGRLPTGRGPRAAISSRIDETFRSVASAGAPELSSVLRTAEEMQIGFPLLLEVAADGQIVYDPSGVLERLLSAFRERLSERGARRVRSGDFWHWDLQGDARPGEWEI